MRLAIVGGTGLVGQYVKSAAEAGGHDCVIIARSTGVDATTGAGLRSAFDGVDAVIDVCNTTSLRRKTATDFFVRSTQNIRESAEASGSQHIVVLSIVGIDRAPRYPYYAAKLAQEREALTGSTPVSVVRATQFHEFAGQVLARMSVPLVAAVPSFEIQPVAARTVGEFLVTVASSGVAGQRYEIAGPEVVNLVAAARRTEERRHVQRRIVPVRVPGSTGRALRSGALLATPGVEIVGPSFSQWLEGPDFK
jgi:uncharacterized protein YbjT (DUF2867 family)